MKGAGSWKFCLCEGSSQENMVVVGLVAIMKMGQPAEGPRDTRASIIVLR